MIQSCIVPDIIDAVQDNSHQTLVVPIAADYKFYGPDKKPLGLAARASREYPIEKALDAGFHLFPDSIYANGAILLVGKRNSSDCYEEWSLRKAIQIMKAVCKHEGIKDLAIQPFCDDGMPWYRIRQMLNEELGSELNITVFTRY